MNTQTHVVRVIPLIRVPSALALLDYHVPSGMQTQPGMIVRIPFRNTKIEGIVWGTVNEEVSKKIKSILAITEQALTPEQLQLLTFLHRESCTALNVIGRTLLPTTHLEHRTVHSTFPDQELVLCPTLQTHEHIITSWVRKLRQTQKSVLVLCPAHSYLHLWQKLLPVAETLVLEPQSTISGRKKILEAMLQRRFLLTTHAGLFFPLPVLEKIIVDFADDPGYFAFEQAPRIDLRRIAHELAKLHGAKIIASARYQNLPVAHQFQKVTPQTFGGRATVQILDRATEPGYRRTTVPQQLIERLATTRTLWLHNRLHEARRYVCKDCGAVVLCAACQHPLQVHSLQPLELWCQQDRTRVLGPETCRVCTSANFVQRGFGLDHTARELRGILKNVSVLQRLQREEPQGLHVVSTTAIAAYPQQRFAAAVIVQPDSLLTPGEYQSEEQFLDTVALVQQFLLPSGILYIPTFQPEHPAFQAFSDPTAWLRKTQSERLRFHYPPEGTLILLRPRTRQRRVTIQPLDAQHLPVHVQLHKGEKQWIVQCDQVQRNSLLTHIRTALDPTWEATVDPPQVRLDQ